MLKRRATTLVMLIIIALTVIAGRNAAAQMACFGDLNGDGYHDGAGEKADCQASGNNWLCPIQAVNCTESVSYSTATCPIGTSLDAASDKCTAAPTCPAGTSYNTVTNLCESIVPAREWKPWLFVQMECTWWEGFVGSCTITIDRDTNNDGIYDVTDVVTRGDGWMRGGGCDSAQAHLNGTQEVINDYLSTYSVPATDFRRQDYEYFEYIDRGQDGCYGDISRYFTKWEKLTPPVCPAGTSLDAASNKCTAAPTCPAESTLNTATDRCEAAPTCATGSYDTAHNSCASRTFACPLGNYACLDNPAGVKQCSPNECVDLSTITPSNTETNLASYQNDGAVSADGQCLGTIYLFSGKPGECRPPGVQTVGHNCCSNRGSNIDLSDGGSLHLIQLEALLQKNCKQIELMTNAARDAGRCHEVGEYCAQRLLRWCVQRRKVYCCFNSKLGRIIHQQGRKQLTRFGPTGSWGTPESPNCVGFLPEEFQMLDFSKIDLSEYYADVQRTMTEQMRQSMGNEVTTFMQQTQQPTSSR